MDKSYAQYLLEKTRKDYNSIAEEFSMTREYLPQDRISLLLKYVKSGDKVLDLGCGNGRFYGALKSINVDYFGTDNSEKMIEIAKRKYPEAVFRAVDALKMPFPENFFDVVFSFAVIHHIPSKELRLQFLSEIKRVLKPQGILILTAWNLNPVRMMAIGEWGRVADFLKHQFLKVVGASKLDFGDFYVSWKNIIPRYIHCFTVNGLRDLAKKSGFGLIESGILAGEKTKESNIYLVAGK